MTAPSGVVAPAATRGYDLVRRVHAGDVDAFGELYAAYRPEVYGFALRRVKNVQTAEDITQDVFVRALAAVGRFQTVGSVGGWLTRIARNLIADRFKSHTFQRERLAADFYGQDAPDQRRYVNPEIATMVGLDRIDVLTALLLLTDEQRQALILRFWHDMSMVEIGAAMGKNEGAVKALLLRGRCAMARLLAEVAGDG